MRAKYVFATVLILIAAIRVPSSGQDKTQYAVFALDTSVSKDSCRLLRTREELIKALAAIGYSDHVLPAISWATEGAALIALRNPSGRPAGYQKATSDESSVTIEIVHVEKALTKAAFVMRVDKGSSSAKRCFLSEGHPHETSDDDRFYRERGSSVGTLSAPMVTQMPTLKPDSAPH